MNEIKNEAPPVKPSLISQIIPWVIAVSILVFMFYKVDFKKVLEILSEARGSWIILAFMVYCIYYYATDILCFYRSYNWFNADISLSETARLRLASYTVQAINGALTEIMSVLYMYKVKKVPVMKSTGTMSFIYFVEAYVLITFLTYCAFMLPEENRIAIEGVPAWMIFQSAIFASWLFLPLWLTFWMTGIKNQLPKVRDVGILVAFKSATTKNYLEVFFYRFSSNLVSLAANIVMLKAIGIEAPLPLLVATVPVMVNIAYMPVSAGGFGGPQLVAFYLLKGYASEDQVLAYSIVWSALFFLTRSLTGMWFIRPVYKSAFSKNSD
jgi:uncharacterized membrane protein YbhN (UPF0104 family)